MSWGPDFATLGCEIEGWDRGTMVKTSKLVESFLLLNRFGDGLLHRLFHTKKWLLRTKSSLLFSSDKNIARVVELVAKKFPELPDIEKVGGHEEFIAQASKLMDTTLHVYELILDIIDWKTKAQAALLQAARGFPSGLTLNGQPFLLRQFLCLISLYCRVLILLSDFPDRRLVIAVYFNAHKYFQLSGGGGGPLTTHGAVDELFSKYSEPTKRLHEDFPAAGSPFVQSLSFTIFNLLGTLGPLFSITEFCQEAPLSLADEKSINIPVLSGLSTHLSSFTDFRDALVFSALVAPEAFRDEGGAQMKLLTLALKRMYTIRIVRNEGFLVHSPISSLFQRYKDASGSSCLKKSKKIISNASGDAQTGEGPKHHHQLQSYLIEQLRDLISIFSDFPALLAPKFPLVLGALSLSRDMVIHYYEHIHPPSGIKVKKGEGATKILTLIGLISQLLGLVEKNKPLVQGYYAEYLRGHHHRSLSRYASTARMSPSEKQVLGAIVSQLQTIDPNAFSQQNSNLLIDLKALRLNWQRLELSFSLAKSGAKDPAFLDRGCWVALHSRYLDEWSKVLQECSSFHLLWSYSTQVSTDFEQTLRSPPLSLYALSIFTVLNHYPRIATTHFPEEKPAIAKFCVEDAERRCSEISSCTYRFLQEVYGYFEELDTQIDPSSAVATALATLPNAKNDRRPPQAGSESEFQARGALKGVESTQRSLINLLRSFHMYPQCQVVDYSFSPIEYFRRNLQQQWRSLLTRITTSSEGGLPVQVCHVERKVNSLNAAISWVESFIDLSLHDVFREVWRDGVGVSLVENREGDDNPLSWITSEPIVFPEHSFIRVYANFFVELVTTMSGQVIYAPTYNLFTNKQGQPPIENLTSVSDLQALCRLVGPLGFRCIHHGLLLEAGKRLVEMVNFCETNAKTLEGLEGSVKRLKNDKEYDSLVRSLKGMDGLQQACLSLGLILKLRQLLRDAQKKVVEEVTPHMYHAVSTTFRQYNTNLLLETKLLPFDSYASDCGLEAMGGTDQGLIYLAKGSIPATSSHLVRLLPIAFATLFHHRIWGESTFVPHLGGYANNLELMALGMSQALINLSAAQITQSEDVLKIPGLLESYLENATSVILALSGEGPKKDSIFFSSEGGVSGKLRGSFPHMVVFLESFLDSTCYLSRESLEKLVSYPLVRSMRQAILNNVKK